MFKFRTILKLLLLLGALALLTPRVSASGPDCGLLIDCAFANFYGPTGAGSGSWGTFVLQKPIGIALSTSEGWKSPQSVWIRSRSAPFDGGIYQQVAATPGTAYTFTAPFAVVDVDGSGWHEGDQVSRRMGIDPYGGTDAGAPSITWSPDFFGRGKFEGDQLQVTEYARASNITVFIRVINPYSDHQVDVFINSPNLQVNSAMPTIAVSAPTATQPPATEPPPTELPTRPPTEIALAPTATEAPADVSTPTETLVATGEAATPDASDTIEPSATSTRAPTRVRRLTPTPAPTVVEDSGIRTQALWAIGATGLLGIGLAGGFFGLAAYYWLRSRAP